MPIGLPEFVENPEQRCPVNYYPKSWLAIANVT